MDEDLACWQHGRERILETRLHSGPASAATANAKTRTTEKKKRIRSSMRENKSPRTGESRATVTSGSPSFARIEVDMTRSEGQRKDQSAGAVPLESGSLAQAHQTNSRMTSA